MKNTILALTLCLSGCAHTQQQDWSRKDTYAEITYQALNVIDAIQTSKFAERPEVREVMPLTRAAIGPEPSNRDAAIFFGSIAISHFIISRMIPDKWRPWWQSGTIAFAAGCVINNAVRYDLP